MQQEGFRRAVVVLASHTRSIVHAGVFKRKRTVSFRLCFNACFGKSVDVAGREAVDQSSVLARVTGHCENVWKEKLCVLVG